MTATTADGIDVGILTREGFPIGEIVSHVDDGGEADEIFSRDCPEYTVGTPGGESIVVMVNHFKRKGYGKPADSNARRKRQAERVAELYRARRDAGQDNVVVLGDLNDTPDSDPLSPLIGGTDCATSARTRAFAATDGPARTRTG